MAMTSFMPSVMKTGKQPNQEMAALMQPPAKPAPLPAPVAPEPQTAQLPALPVNGFLSMPETADKALQLAAQLSHSQLVPMNLRSTSEIDHTADVYLVLQEGAAFGMTPARALRSMFVIDGRVGMYTKAKAGICHRYGRWQVSIDPKTATATATGYRFGEENRPVSVSYTGNDAMLRGKMTRDSNGAWRGDKGWQDKWPDMLQTRALSRLFDRLFPDVIEGVPSLEELEDASVQPQAPIMAEVISAAEPEVFEPAPEPEKPRKGCKKAAEEVIEPAPAPTPAPAAESAPKERLVASIDSGPSLPFELEPVAEPSNIEEPIF